MFSILCFVKGRGCGMTKRILFIKNAGYMTHVSHVTNRGPRALESDLCIIMESTLNIVVNCSSLFA